MTKTPATSLAKLFRLRNRERLFLLIWGVTCWLAIVLTILTCALLTDWIIDKFRETPFWLVRVPLTVLQLAAYSVAGYLLIFRAAQGPSLIKLAKRVEESIPGFDHRLITAIQLTRADAQTQGMSPELIAMVTAEAESISSKEDLVRLADTRRLKWSAALLAWPLGILAFLLLFFKPALLVILLQRQCLMAADIPRDIHLKSVTPKLWPAGDEVVIRYEVTSASGRIDKEMRGKVFVEVKDQPEAVYDLGYEASLADDKAIYMAKVPHSSVNFRYRARLGDGRTKGWDEVVFEPRPQLTIYGAWVSLPDYVPSKPGGGRYEIEQNNGDVKGYDRSRARVRIHVQKEISDAKLILFTRAADGFSEEPVGAPLDADSTGKETAADGSTHWTAEFSFNLRLGAKEPRLIGYRVAATDKFGFTSLDNPRRSIEVTEPELPYVAFLPERFADAGLNPTEDDILEGMPIRLDSYIPIDYIFRTPIGAAEPTPNLSKDKKYLTSPARLKYRIIDKEGKEWPWAEEYLDEIPETAESGRFDLRRACFQNREYGWNPNSKRIEIDFHAMPAERTDDLPRLEGGGRLHLKTKDLPKKMPDGKIVGKLEVGDKIEYFMEVRDRNPAAGRPPGVSEPRLKEIVTAEELARRGVEKLTSDQKLRDLEKKQQGVFARPNN